MGYQEDLIKSIKEIKEEKINYFNIEWIVVNKVDIKILKKQKVYFI